jgi:hypothetical protein
MYRLQVSCTHLCTGCRCPVLTYVLVAGVLHCPFAVEPLAVPHRLRLLHEKNSRFLLLVIAFLKTLHLTLVSLNRIANLKKSKEKFVK